MKKLKTKMLVILVPIIIISLLASSGMVYQFSKNKITEQILTSNEKESSLLANETGLWLGRFFTLVDMTAKTDNKIPLDNQQRLELMAEMMKIDPAVTDIYLGLANGVMLDGSGWEPPADYDPRTRPWYTSAINANQTAYSDPYVDLVTNQVVTSVSSPILDQSGNVKGVLAADVQLNAVTDRINQLKIGDDGYVVIMTNAGVFVAHPDPEFISKNGFTDFDEGVKKLTEVVTSQENGTYEYVFEGDKKVASFAAIPNTNWKIMVTMPFKSLTKDLDALLLLILFSTLFFAIVTIIVVTFITKKITKPIEKLNHATHMLSEGDLTQRTTIVDSTEIGQLSKSFNTMADNLRNLVKGITVLSEDVHIVSGKMNQSSKKTEEIAVQISYAINDLAKGAEQQSDSVNMSVNKITSMTEAFEEISKSIQAVYNTTEIINVLVANGEEAIRIQNNSMEENTKATDAVNDAIHMLEIKTREIGQIVSVIDGIASQTNLLALNASIEAARAGEQGRGFSVVADEIRKLAEQSSQSTGRIGQSVQEIIERTKSAVDQAIIAEGAVKLQEKSVSQVADIFKNVKDSIKEMKVSFDDVKKRNDLIREEASDIRDEIHSISDVIELNSAGSEEVAASTEQQVSTLQDVTKLSGEVEQLANQLKQEVDKFKI